MIRNKLLEAAGKNKHLGRVLKKTRNSLQRSPRSVKLHITSECDMGCSHCYAKKVGEAVEPEKWLDIIDSLYSHGVRCIEILGGEPLMSDKFIQLIEKVAAYGLDCTVYTNGKYLDDDMIEKFADLPIVPIVALKYDTPDANVEDLMQKMVKRHIPVVAFMTVMKSNASSIRVMMRNALRMGAFPAMERFMDVLDNGSEKKLSVDDWQESLKLMRKVYSPYMEIIEGAAAVQGNSCSCYRSQMSIMQDGSVLACQFLPQTESVGNVFEDGISDIWWKMSGIREDLKQTPKACRSCDLLDKCGGGCRTHGFYEHGKYGEKDPLCTGKRLPTIGICAFTVIRSLPKGDRYLNKSLLRII